jgi:hypothetical protein
LQAEKWKNHAAKQIKRFAHPKKTVEIQASVEQHFRIIGGLALDRPVSVFGLVSDGIKYFSKETSLWIFIILTVYLTELSYRQFPCSFS